METLKAMGICICCLILLMALASFSRELYFIEKLLIFEESC